MKPALSQTVDVETPELVVLSYTIAGVGSRASAALIDYFICLLCLIAIVVGTVTAGIRFGSGKFSDNSATWIAAVLSLLQFALLWLYYVLFEALADGQTPGKRIIGLRVVRDGGLEVTFEASAIRNLVRIVDMQPAFFYGVGIVSVVMQKRGKRLGDLAAGTIVVKEDLISRPIVAEAPRRARPDATPLVARLSSEEYTLLDRFVQRRMEFTPERRATLAAAIAERLGPQLDSAGGDRSISGLVRLHETEHAARAQGIASSRDTGAARERHAIVATGAGRWAKFAERLQQAQRGGLRSMGERGVREFVEEYRELSGDLARLRTATRGHDAAELFYLNRLVAGAHNVLYRRRSFSLRGIVQFIFGDVPAEMRRSAAPILLAATLLFAPAFITARAIVLHPDLAPSLLPPAMINRAEDGMKNVKTGKGYIDAPQVLRPLMASSIITNNVQVTFAAFAFGITAGLLTVFVLVSNGVSIGAVFGLYQSKGIAGLLVAFVAPHGVLELSAIAIAGGGGFLLAAALLIPGNRTRRRALTENGRRAIKLVAGSAFLLVFAGTLEGFVSPIPSWPLRDKLAVSAITAVLLVLYVRPWAGFVARRRDSRDSTTARATFDALTPATAPLGL